MSGDTQARVRAMYVGEFSLGNFHPEAEWHLRADLPDAATLRGHEAIANMVAQWYDTFDDLVLEPVEVSEVAGRVVVQVELRGRIKGGDEPVAMQEVHVVTMRDGKILEIREYRHIDEALRSLGLAA